MAATEKQKAYRVPAALLAEGKEGELLKFCLQKVYGKRGYQIEITEFLKIVRQTVFQWVKHGLPPERKESFESFVESKKTEFYLPSNATLGQFIREREDRPGPRGPVLNQPLLELLVDLVAYRGEKPNFGLDTINSLSLKMKNVASPHLFWKWAYHDGGIPVTYIEDWIRFAQELEAYDVMEKVEYRDPAVFASRVRRLMCVDGGYFDEFYGNTSKKAPVAVEDAPELTEAT